MKKVENEYSIYSEDDHDVVLHYVERSLVYPLRKIWEPAVAAGLLTRERAERIVKDARRLSADPETLANIVRHKVGEYDFRGKLQDSAE